MRLHNQAGKDITFGIVKAITEPHVHENRLMEVELWVSFTESHMFGVLESIGFSSTLIL